MPTKKNFLLIVPRYLQYGNSGAYVMPLGILYISSYIKRFSNYAVIHTLNLNHHEGNEYDVIAHYIKEHSIDVFGVGGLSGEYSDLKRVIVYARKIKPEIIIVLGGGIITSDPETAMKAFPEVDFGIIGEGEITLYELTEYWAGIRSLEDVKGIIFRKQGLFRTGKRKEIADLDKLPFPDYEGFNYDHYLSKNIDLTDEGKKYTQLSIIGGRSCRYNCTFCFHPTGNTYRQRSLDSIFEEIDYLIAHYNITYIALREELFATDNVRVYDFCQRIASYNFDWSIQLRVDSINEELISILRNTRCRYVFIGVESACDEVLKSMRKGINIAQIEAALKMLHDAGINFRTGVILGDTAETHAMAKQTIDWYKKMSAKYRIYIDMVIAFPGTAIYKRAVKSGAIPDPVKFLQDNCPIINASAMTQDEFSDIVSEVENLNHRHYNVKQY